MRLIESVLQGCQKISRPHRKFLCHVLELLWMFPGLATFRNLSRYSSYCEKSFSRWYARGADFVKLNQALIESHVPPEHEQALALDASFITKSGKHSYGVDSFWNGCHSRSERGQEISLLAWVDLSAQSAYALSVRQTPARQGQEPVSESRMQHYLKQVREVVQQVSSPRLKYLLTDGGYSNKPFLDGVAETGLYQIGKLRRDSTLRYLYQGPHRNQRGRRRRYDGKVNWSDLSRFERTPTDQAHLVLYSQTLNHPRLKRDLRVVVVMNTLTSRYALLFSTDTTLDAETIYRYYRARFQIEFVFRDSKQFTGLSDCQARSQQKLNTHFNLSLTALNLAKMEAGAANEPDAVFSMASLKRRAFNQHLVDRILERLAQGHTIEKFSPEYIALCNYGTINQQAA